jgi:cytochrome c oxidase subunit 2
VSRRRHVQAASRAAARIGAWTAAVALVGGCLPAAATAEGRAIADLYVGFVAIALVVAGVVFGLTTFAILRYRAGTGPDAALPAQVRGNVRLEALWTAIPIVIVAGLFIGTLLVLGRVEARSEAPGAELRVEAFRWGWSFSYPSAGVTVSGVGPPGPEAVVPVDEPIRVTVAARDVVHAFYVPVFLFKRDAIPGRESVFEFTVDEPGTYRGQCAEFCGIYHSRMPFSIRAVPRAEFDAWLAAQPQASPAP